MIDKSIHPGRLDNLDISMQTKQMKLQYDIAKCHTEFERNKARDALRDQFAAAALTGLIVQIDKLQTGTYKKTAVHAYVFADKMIEEKLAINKPKPLSERTQLLNEIRTALSRVAMPMVPYDNIMKAIDKVEGL
jgi:hypothetical protein